LPSSINSGVAFSLPGILFGNAPKIELALVRSSLSSASLNLLEPLSFLPPQERTNKEIKKMLNKRIIILPPENVKHQNSKIKKNLKKKNKKGQAKACPIFKVHH
jgi:hypothetical protein